MHATLLVIRAVGAEFARRIVRPMIIAGFVAAVLLLALGGWLTTQSAWWWLLQAVFILGTLIFIVLTLVVRGIVQAVNPSLSTQQKQAVRSFVDKLERVAEHLQTPHIVLLFRVVRDTIKPQAHGFIETVSTESKTLAPDFAKLRNDFE